MSVLKRVKICLRAIMQQHRLSDLALLSGEERGDIVAQHWCTHNDRQRERDYKGGACLKRLFRVELRVFTSLDPFWTN